MLSGLECGEPLADAASERDDPLALVAIERLPPGRNRVVATASSLKYLGQTAERVTMVRG